jgi:hypothetical protein
MRRCEDEKMFYRPPLLEEPCAQTLSGKIIIFQRGDFARPKGDFSRPKGDFTRPKISKNFTWGRTN